MTITSHVVDIDIYHTVEDVWAYNHGLFLHTVHHVDAGRATHRSYPRAAGSSGGGPSCEHNYTTGLMLRYFLTGDLAARETAADLAQFVIDLDDGNRTPFRWLDHGYTGLCTASGDLRYQGPGRVSGNSLNALLDGHRLTGERRFLDKAEQVIARCVHPQQDLVGLNLGDVERRWFYTVFLHSLAKYLDHKLELDEMDAAYDYARASLLHYARWMEEHEYPYLERPWVLQYPTETWAAQDVRKSEVFRYAAMHATGGERGRFAERADYFFDYAISTLERMPSRTLARPVVLLASHGWMHAYFRHYPDMPVPAPVGRVGQWPPPLIFVPQRTRAIRRARRLAVAAIVLLAAAAAAAVLSLL